MITFNKPFLTGNETKYISEAVATLKISGNGIFTRKCQDFFEDRYGFKKCLLTNSCTDALEMAAILIGIKQGDEVIMPSYAFVSTANAFILRGAEIRFIDSLPYHPNMDVSLIEPFINSKTKAIVPVHYAGVACDMDAIMDIANKYNLYVVEDAAQAIDSYYKNKPLGSIGHLGAFSFHETKNIISGEGGMLVINDPKFKDRAEIIWEKGTNRSAFWRGEVDKYGWVDIGSSFLPSEITAAFLFAQLESLDHIQAKRKKIWGEYYKGLKKLASRNLLSLPIISENATNNGHMFFILCKSLRERDNLIAYLKERGIQAVFHYQSLHKSTYYRKYYQGIDLYNSDNYTDTLLRLPMYYELTDIEVDYIVSSISSFYTS